jgi:hypothetical protein
MQPAVNTGAKIQPLLNGRFPSELTKAMLPSAQGIVVGHYGSGIRDRILGSEALLGWSDIGIVLAIQILHQTEKMNRVKRL